ncbi:MAG: hypothetical protein KAG66_19300 [Methylococcales bacterium]|nr:hypothetical protein [Methylococcales bacterium]
MLEENEIYEDPTDALSVCRSAVDQAQYLIRENASSRLLCAISFQNAPIGEVGINGVQVDVLLAICSDRLRGLNTGVNASPFNALALHHIDAAAIMLENRTIDRIERNVEGTNKP